MNIIFLLAPLALFLSLAFMAAFLWATRNGQWDDLDLTPRRLLEDQPPEKDPYESTN